MPVRCSGAAAYAVALLVVVLLGPCGSASARIVRGLSLDRDVPSADVVVVARIVSSTLRKQARWIEGGRKRSEPPPANAGLLVDEHEVSAKVLVTVKGDRKAGALVKFRHRLRPATGGAFCNGFSSHPFQVGGNYLLVLKKEQDGVLAPPAVEQGFYPTFPDALMPKLPAARPSESTLAHVLRLLLARFEFGAAPDGVGVGCAVVLTSGKAGRAYAKDSATRARLLARLEPLSDRWLRAKDHDTVLRLLHELGAPVPAKKLLGWILDPALPRKVRIGLVGGLRRVPPTDHLAALDQIMASGGDLAVRNAAIRDFVVASKRVSGEDAYNRHNERRAAERREEEKAREEAHRQSRPGGSKK